MLKKEFYERILLTPDDGFDVTNPAVHQSINEHLVVFFGKNEFCWKQMQIVRQK